MGSLWWLETREDGSASVSIRSVRDQVVSRETLEAVVASWLIERQASGSDPMDELLEVPRIQTRGSASTDIVVEAKSGAATLFDLLISLAVSLREARIGYSPRAFIDRVGGQTLLLMEPEPEIGSWVHIIKRSDGT